MFEIFRQDEPDDVFVELVDAMADSAVPMLVLAVLVVLIGSYVLSEVRSPAVLTATLVTLVACAVKIALILLHGRSLRTGQASDVARTRRRESVHAASTLAVGASVGFLTTTVFLLPAITYHLPATSLLFGYCAGIINRLSIRPRIAVGALLVAGIPAILAALAGGTKAHVLLALVFGGFLIGAIQSVAYAYETARRGVTLRLQLAALARRDPLTGLYNRLGLREAFDALPQDGRCTVAVHAFDLDGFKAINDRLGHAAGDRLLQILADRIQSSVSATTIVARTGGDEFVLVQVGPQDEGEVRDLAARIHDQLTRLCDLGGDRPLRVGLSLGYAVGLLPRVRLDDLILQADAASYGAKRDGGGIRAHGQAEALPLLAALANPRRAASA